MIIFPRAKIHAALMNGAPTGSFACTSKSGWTNSELFLKWMQHFINITGASVGNKMLLILDKHVSHISASVMELCRENGVIMLSLPECF
jgi:hypothetical protein